MPDVVSSDGTTIHYSVLGQGPPVVVLHGSLTTGASWLPVAELLGDRFTVMLADRRGRAPSGAGARPHSLAREVDDARAVLAAAGPRATLVGHSYGGTVALETALAAGAGEIGSLIVYEPAVRCDGAPDRREAVAEFRRRLESSLGEGLMFFAQNFSSVSPEEAAALPHPASPEELATLAPTLADELDAVESLPPSVERYRDVPNSTLLLAGELGNARRDETLAALRRALQNATVTRLAGQGHVAMLTDPSGVAAAVSAFLEA